MSKTAATKSSQKTDKLAGCFKALSDPHRIGIIKLLCGGERCVCEIYELLGLPQNLVSHHLKILREAGLVSCRRDGTWMRYRLTVDCADGSCEKLLELATQLTARHS